MGGETNKGAGNTLSPDGCGWYLNHFLLISSCSNNVECVCVQVIEPLIWSCVTMESCVPLMNVRYLQLRGSLYTAVCQCYYTMNHPLEAEVN